MLAELDVVVFLKSHDSLERTAARVFGALRSTFEPVTTVTERESEETVGGDETADESDSGGIAEGGDVIEGYAAAGLGFRALLFPNEGEQNDPEFDDYQFGLEITSDYWCVDLDTLDLEGPLSELYARQLAFELDMETATEILLETTEEAEIFEIRTYRRNPQFRLDQAPTTPRVFMTSARQVELEYEEDEDEAVDAQDLGDENVDGADEDQLEAEELGEQL